MEEEEEERKEKEERKKKEERKNSPTPNEQSQSSQSSSSLHKSHEETKRLISSEIMHLMQELQNVHKSRRKMHDRLLIQGNKVIDQEQQLANYAVLLWRCLTANIKQQRHMVLLQSSTNNKSDSTPKKKKNRRRTRRLVSLCLDHNNDMQNHRTNTKNEVCRTIALLVEGKLHQDAQDDVNHKHRQPFTTFIRDYFLRQYGLKALALSAVESLFRNIKRHCKTSARCYTFGLFIGINHLNHHEGDEFVRYFF